MVLRSLAGIACRDVLRATHRHCPTNFVSQFPPLLQLAFPQPAFPDHDTALRCSVLQSLAATLLAQDWNAGRRGWTMQAPLIREDLPHGEAQRPTNAARDP